MAPRLHSACYANTRLYVYRPSTHRNMCPPGDKWIGDLRSLGSQSRQSVSMTEVDIPKSIFSFHTHTHPELDMPNPHTKNLFKNTGTSSYSPHAVSRDRTLEFKGNQNYTVGE